METIETVELIEIMETMETMETLVNINKQIIFSICLFFNALKNKIIFIILIILSRIHETTISANKCEHVEAFFKNRQIIIVVVNSPRWFIDTNGNLSFRITNG